MKKQVTYPITYSTNTKYSHAEQRAMFGEHIKWRGIKQKLLRSGLIITTTITTALLVWGTLPVQAITDNQKNVLDSGIGFFNTEIGCTASTGSGSPLTGNDNEQKAFNYFVSKGLSGTGAAAIMGNFMHESGMDPTIEQAAGSWQDMNPNDYDRAVGIAQWDGGRRVAIINAAGSLTRAKDLGFQLDYVWGELNGYYKDALTALESATDITQATESFELQYEKSADQPGSAPWQDRITKAKEALQLYGASSTNTPGSTTGTLTGTSPCPGSGGGTGGGVSGQCDSPAPTGGYDAVKAVLLTKFKINLIGVTNADWATQTYNTMCAMAKAPTYFSRLFATGPITVNLHGGGCSGGHASATTGVDIYGFCNSQDWNRFLLTHELGHMFSFRNPSVYQAFGNQVWGHTPALPTYNCQEEYNVPPLYLKGPYEAECWADMIGEYFVYFDLRMTVGGQPPGPSDFKQYPTQYSAYYNFARDQLFGGVEYKSL